ncbi:unnamed protein product [Prorocentrum cordatum]|uniref:SWIM-type domain-containing protein n=1 Tax=Prorocentrum cordatum TaxID=2364126 RepID=A0ABN9R1H4_9DINO|nr:unnamed protein product [Polarella glacialis]
MLLALLQILPSGAHALRRQAALRHARACLQAKAHPVALLCGSCACRSAFGAFCRHRFAISWVFGEDGRPAAQLVFLSVVRAAWNMSTYEHPSTELGFGTCP